MSLQPGEMNWPARCAGCDHLMRDGGCRKVMQGAVNAWLSGRDEGECPGRSEDRCPSYASIDGTWLQLCTLARGHNGAHRNETHKWEPCSDKPRHRGD